MCHPQSGNSVMQSCRGLLHDWGGPLRLSLPDYGACHLVLCMEEYRAAGHSNPEKRLEISCQKSGIFLQSTRVVYLYPFHTSTPLGGEVQARARAQADPPTVAGAADRACAGVYPLA